MKQAVPRATTFYRAHKDDPEFLHQRREYARLQRELKRDPTSEEGKIARIKQSGCVLCGERDTECLDVYQADAGLVCLCANCRLRWRAGRVGLPSYVPEALRWCTKRRARTRRRILAL